METDQIAKFLIYFVHAPLGGVALLAGGVALIAKKGFRVHKKSGIIFFYSLLISGIAAFIISLLPNHESPFLFAVGIFSTYFLLGGYRSLKFKQKDVNLVPDKIIAFVIIAAGLLMILYPIILERKLNIVLLVFGIVGIGFGVRDLKLFKDRKQVRKKWLKLHIGKMTGGYIASVSAFFVVNQILPGLWNWFLPGIIGSIYISFWIRKISGKKPVMNQLGGSGIK